jgi:serine phosphatase RsbU (regulator of sigma subunit)
LPAAQRVQQIAKRLLGAVDTFVAGAPQHDDMTLLVMRLVEAE